MKKLISFILTIAMILSLITVIPARSSAESNADFEYTLDSPIIKINKYIGDNTSVEIPNMINGYRVTSIGDHAFQNNTKLRTVFIPDSVSSIGYGAFDGMTNLKCVLFRSTWITWSKILVFGNNEVFNDGEKMVYNAGGELSYKIINKNVYIYGTNESVETLMIPTDIERFSRDRNTRLCI